MSVFNRIELTQDEETCILKFLQEAADCGYPSGNEPWYPVINSIVSKYYSKKYENTEYQYPF